jgi:hypothetical protein
LRNKRPAAKSASSLRFASPRILGPLPSSICHQLVKIWHFSVSRQAHFPRPSPLLEDVQLKDVQLFAEIVLVAPGVSSFVDGPQRPRTSEKRLKCTPATPPSMSGSQRSWPTSAAGPMKSIDEASRAHQLDPQSPIIADVQCEVYNYDINSTKRLRFARNPLPITPPSASGTTAWPGLTGASTNILKRFGNFKQPLSK